MNIEQARFNKNDYGQCAEHLGTGIYKGMWVGLDSSIPHTKGWPQVDARDLNRYQSRQLPAAKR